MPEIFSAQVLLMLALGVAIGISFGIIPGLTGTLGLALALPFSFQLPVLPAIGLLVGVYKGSNFGGAISAITMGTPGTPDSVVNLFDGRRLAEAGRPRKALLSSLYASVSADTVASILVVALLVPFGRFALLFGTREIVALAFFALVIAIGFSGTGRISRALVSSGIGLGVAVIGSDPMTGMERATFGIDQLRSGIGVLPFLIGVFALGELMRRLVEVLRDTSLVTESYARIAKDPDDKLSIGEFLRCWRELGISTMVGLGIGALPGPGGTVAAFTGYGLAGRFSKAEFGTGTVEGQVASEGGDAASALGSLVPLFAFGIPGSASAAIFMGAFLLQGISPGPQMIVENNDVMTAIFGMLLVSALVNLVVSRGLLMPFTLLAKIPEKVLLPVLFMVITVGIYSSSNSIIDVWVLIISGFVGYFLIVGNYPLPPLLITYMVAPLLESNLRRGIVLSAGDPLYWLGSPIAISIITVSLIVAVYLLRHPIELSMPGTGSGVERGSRTSEGDERAVTKSEARP